MSAVIDRPTTYQDYSIDRKAEVLAMVAANDGNVLQTSRETGISDQTINYWLKNADRFREFSEQKQVNLADQCETDARYYLHLARNKAHEAPYNHLMTGAAIAIDKMQLLRGLPTSITDSTSSVELTVILADALSEAIDVTPGPGNDNG